MSSRRNNKLNECITINNHDIEDVTSFTYNLASVINITGGTDEDVLIVKNWETT